MYLYTLQPALTLSLSLFGIYLLYTHTYNRRATTLYTLREEKKAETLSPTH